MPLVHVYTDRSTNSDVIRQVANVLPSEVSAVLSVSHRSTFPPTHVTIKTFDSNSGEAWERCSASIMVVIWAHNYPEREARLDELARTLAFKLRPFVPLGRSVDVLIVLQPIGLGIA